LERKNSNVPLCGGDRGTGIMNLSHKTLSLLKGRDKYE
jgi:hypothetical protein